jgi:hypothetical protein
MASHRATISASTAILQQAKVHINCSESNRCLQFVLAGITESLAILKYGLLNDLHVVSFLNERKTLFVDVKRGVDCHDEV